VAPLICACLCVFERNEWQDIIDTEPWLSTYTFLSIFIDALPAVALYMNVSFRAFLI
jgi:hypothetical protein